MPAAFVGGYCGCDFLVGARHFLARPIRLLLKHLIQNKGGSPSAVSGHMDARVLIEFLQLGKCVGVAHSLPPHCAVAYRR